LPRFWQNFVGTRWQNRNLFCQSFSEMATIEIYFAYTLAEFKGCMPHLPKFDGNRPHMRLNFYPSKITHFTLISKMHVWANLFSPLSPFYSS
jgi:hypothetical protein